MDRWRVNDQLDNNSPNRLTDAELNGRLENHSPNRWTGGELWGADCVFIPYAEYLFYIC